VFLNGRYKFVIALLRIAPAVVCAALIGAGCSRPDFSESNKGPTATASAPDLPSWALRYEGHDLGLVGAQRLGCSGFVDGVSARYSGPRPGVQISGWGWDRVATRSFSKIVITSDNSVVGAGSNGIERPDVPMVLPFVTSSKTGWTAITHKISGPIQAWGVSDSRVCFLGRFDMK